MLTNNTNIIRRSAYLRRNGLEELTIECSSFSSSYLSVWSICVFDVLFDTFNTLFSLIEVCLDIYYCAEMLTVVNRPPLYRVLAFNNTI